MMPLERFTELPNNEMTADVHRIAEWFWDRSTKKVRPVRDDGFADGAGIFSVFRPDSWVAVKKQRATGVFGVSDVTTNPYDLLDARKCDYDVMRKEFFATLANPAVYHKTKR